MQVNMNIQKKSPAIAGGSKNVQTRFRIPKGDNEKPKPKQPKPKPKPK
jgi:hypothetical protein